MQQHGALDALFELFMPSGHSQAVQKALEALEARVAHHNKEASPSRTAAGAASGTSVSPPHSARSSSAAGARSPAPADDERGDAQTAPTTPSSPGGGTAKLPQQPGPFPAQEPDEALLNTARPEAPLLLPGEAGGPEQQLGLGAAPEDASPEDFINFHRGRSLKGVRLNSCALIGSSSILNDQGSGQIIDSHDTVIRVNRVPVKGDGKDFGTHTDIFVGNCRSWLDPTVVTSVKGIRFRCKKACPKVQLLKSGCKKSFISPSTMNSSLVAGTLKRSTYAVISYLHLFQHRTSQTVPTMGIHSFFTFAPICNNLTLYGFGGASTSAGGDNGITAIHDVIKDNELLDGILAPDFELPPKPVRGHSHGHWWLKRWLPKIRASVKIVRPDTATASKPTLDWPREKGAANRGGDVLDLAKPNAWHVTSKRPIKHRITVRRVEVREKPTTKSKLLGYFVRGQQVPLRESDTSGEWRKVISRDFTGWVNVERGGEKTVERI